MSWKRSVLPISCGDVTAHGTNARRPDYSSSSYRADEHVHGWWRRFVPNPLASVSAKAVQAAGARARRVDPAPQRARRAAPGVRRCAARARRARGGVAVPVGGDPRARSPAPPAPRLGRVSPRLDGGVAGRGDRYGAGSSARTSASACWSLAKKSWLLGTTSWRGWSAHAAAIRASSAAASSADSIRTGVCW